MTGAETRAECRKQIKAFFEQVVKERAGSLKIAGAELGVSRQAMEQYADGSIPGADVLLAAFVQWGIPVRIEDPASSSSTRPWWECGMIRKSADRAKPTRQPEQLPLFRAIDDLDEQSVDVRILRKGPSRIELGVEIAFIRKAH
jgi:hypothetical protein